MRRLVAKASPWTLRGFFGVIILSLAFKWPTLPSLAVALPLLALSRIGPARPADPDPRECAAPVTGPWVGFNSPADKVPSHGTHGYGQTYAIDIVGPSGRDVPRRLTLGWTTRRPEECPAFGRPAVAAADGTVVTAVDRMRDHRTRDSLLPILSMMASGAIRELGGVRFLMGNHVVIDHGDGAWGVYAHLRRGSVSVRPGDRVSTGQQIGEVGNTGNTSEPHMHFHLMNDPDPYVGRGLPFRWTNVVQHEDDIDLGVTWGQQVSGTVTPGVPGAAQTFTAVTDARA